MNPEEIKERIARIIPDAAIQLVDLAGDNDHFEVTVTSETFRDMPRVKQHKLVYSAFGEDMGTTLHALSVKTNTP
jgi:stress-induced morphogen